MGVTFDTGVERGKHVNKFGKIVSLASLGFVVVLSLNGMKRESNTTFIYYSNKITYDSGGVLDHIRCELIAKRVSGETPGGIFT